MKHMMWIFVKIAPPMSNKYPQHTFLGVNKKKKLFIPVLLLYVGILHSGLLFLTGELYEANTVMITRVLCIIKLKTITSDYTLLLKITEELLCKLIYKLYMTVHTYRHNSSIKYGKP